MATLSAVLRGLSIDMIDAAHSGHPGLPLGMADVLSVLFRDILAFDSNNPKHPNRDRLIFSAGHGSALLYAALYLTGYTKPAFEDLKKFRQLGSCTAGHPEFGLIPGVETSSGPLGQGLATAVGMSLAQTINNDPYKVYVIVSDGDLMEGITQEAISFAGHNKLSSLVVLWDDNQITIDGPIHLSCSDDQKKRFEASNWEVRVIDGHNESEILSALSHPHDRPLLIACKTTIGRGSQNAGTSLVHGTPLTREDMIHVKKFYHLPPDPFEIEEADFSQWREVARYGRERLEGKPDTKTKKQWPCLKTLFEIVKHDFQAKDEATRQTSKRVLDCIAPHLENLIGGSADLTPSNNTKTDNTPYIHYGIREHAMGAIMNGLCLSGFRPFGGTFLVFSDYCRPAIRMAAMMELPVIYVMTHDSIGVGEDGSTHQPIEHLAALRAIPNLLVFRPGDSFEVLESWEVALRQNTKPCVIALTRQNVKTHRSHPPKETMTKKGGYIIRESCLDEPIVTILATGSEVDLAIQAQIILEAQKIATRVVSMVCFELFDMQDAAYQNSVLGKELRVGIEAGCEWGWHKYIGESGLFLGVNHFGKSGKSADLFHHFGLTVEQIVEKIKTFLKTKSIF